MDDFDLGYYEEIGDELVGDELVGDDIDALLAGYDIGAARRAMARRAAPARRGSPVARAAAAKRVQNAALLRDVAPTKARQYAMPLDSVVTVAAGATAIINSQPQVLFRPERLVIDQNANSWLINDLRVGKNSQFVSAGALTGAAFAAGAFGVRLKCDTAQISQIISVSITNNSGGALRFLAVLFGDAVE